jgi:hypothetical protein
MKRTRILRFLMCGAYVLALYVAALGGDLTIATFNAEFLTRPRVHVRFGLPLTLRGAAKEQWSRAGFRDTKFNEATRNVARFLATIDADVWALTEVGDETDVQELVHDNT